MKREGSDVTVVAVALMVQWALDAAEKLKNRISVEMIDPRTLGAARFEDHTCFSEKDGPTGHCGRGQCALWVCRGVEHAGDGARFDLLDAPIRRVCTKNYPIPGYFMEKHVFPKFEEVVAAIEEVVK